MTNKQIEAVARCPCCDSEAAVMSGRRYRIRCQGCRLCTIEFDTPQEAVKTWNRRGGM